MGKDGTAVANVLEMLVRARLITTDAGEVEVAHEALIRRWPWLRTSGYPTTANACASNGNWHTMPQSGATVGRR